MAYKSKNLSRSRRKAFSEKSNTQSQLHKAIGSIRQAGREQVKLDEMIKLNEASKRDSRFLGYAAKRNKDNRVYARAGYDSWKKNYDSLIATDKYKDSTDNFFPTFDEHHEKRTKARIGGVEMSQSDMNTGNFDIEKLNLYMQLHQLSKGK